MSSEKKQDTLGPTPPPAENRTRVTVSDLFLKTPEERALSRDATKAHLRYEPEQREAIMERVKVRLIAGERMTDIATDIGVPWRTIDYWLAQLGDEYRQLRRAWIDGKLTQAEERIHDAPNKLEFMRARELFKVASWYAERRDPERYAPKQEITHHTEDARTPEQIRERILMLEGKLGIKTIEAQVNATHELDGPSDHELTKSLDTVER